MAGIGEKGSSSRAAIGSRTCSAIISRKVLSPATSHPINAPRALKYRQAKMRQNDRAVGAVHYAVRRMIGTITSRMTRFRRSGSSKIRMKRKLEDQPVAPALTHEPGQALPCEIETVREAMPSTGG